jgi:hypothetical protein
LSETAQQLAFQKFIDQYNQDYVMKCKELGLKNEYTLECAGKQVTFVRKRLTIKQFNDLEQERNKVDKENLGDTDPMASAKRVADVYFISAQAYLTNKETGQPITKEEYENSFWEDIKPILDSCHLRTIIGPGNSEPASKT